MSTVLCKKIIALLEKQIVDVLVQKHRKFRAGEVRWQFRQHMEPNMGVRARVRAR
ncbi:hypothetical protein ACLOJK_004843 [Asimina triloba]